MLGIRFIKSQPTVHLMQFRAGKVMREGSGLSFFYYAPTTTLVAVPVAIRSRHWLFSPCCHIGLAMWVLPIRVSNRGQQR